MILYLAAGILIGAIVVLYFCLFRQPASDGKPANAIAQPESSFKQSTTFPEIAQPPADVRMSATPTALHATPSEINQGQIVQDKVEGVVTAEPNVESENNVKDQPSDKTSEKDKESIGQKGHVHSGHKHGGHKHKHSGHVHKKKSKSKKGKKSSKKVKNPQ